MQQVIGAECSVECISAKTRISFLLASRGWYRRSRPGKSGKELSRGVLVDMMLDMLLVYCEALNKVWAALEHYLSEFRHCSGQLGSQHRWRQ